MAGAGSSSIRSGSIRETVNGTTPATPAFKTMHQPIIMMAKPDVIQGRSLIARGGSLGKNIQGINVSGSWEGPLVYGVSDEWLETLMQSTWAANVLKDGKAYVTQSVENTIPAGAGGTATYFRFRGVEATGGKLTLKSKSPAMLSLDLFGVGSDNATTVLITGATYVDPTEFDPMSSGLDVGTITMPGYSPDCIESMEVDFAFDRRDPQPRISSNDFCGVTRGDFLPKIMANMYFETGSTAIYNAARAAHATFALTIPLGSVTLKKYSIVFPRCTFGGTEIDPASTAVMHKVEILPQYDAASGATCTITRAIV